MVRGGPFWLCAVFVGPVWAAAPGCARAERVVSADERWAIREGRFYQNGRWVFLRTGKLLRGFHDPQTADGVMQDIDVLSGRLNFNNFSINIYPDAFDGDGDGRIDPERREAYRRIGDILDHCWRRGVFCCLSFETYNIGGGGTPRALFERFADLAAVNGLGEPAIDVEYFPNGKPVPSIFHPAYLEWSRGFIRHFLEGLGAGRTSRLLYVETTVEPQYLGQCNHGPRDERRAFLDFSEASRRAFVAWQSVLPAEDPGRRLTWPRTQEQRDAMLGNRDFNRFRGAALAEWLNGDIRAIRSAAPTVYIAVDYNGRFDDPHNIRIGDHEAFLSALRGVDIIQIAPHTPEPWGPLAWDEVRRINERLGRGWAISEHMTATGDWAVDDAEMTRILENTLARGTRWGWEFVNAGNSHARDSFMLYEQDWSSRVLDVIDGEHWQEWLRRIGAARFAARPRAPQSAPTR